MMMTDQLFAPASLPVVRSLSGKDDLIFRDRSLLPPCARFGPAADGFELLVTAEAASVLQEGTRHYAPNEAFGKLLGRTFRDQRGVYTLITGVVYATPAEASRGHVRLSEREMADLRRAAIQAHPAAEELGWTHSHPAPSDYSVEDRREQRTWPGRYHVGVVTFMQSERNSPWAYAYRGPAADPLPSAGRLDLIELSERGSPSDECAPPTIHPTAVGRRYVGNEWRDQVSRPAKSAYRRVWHRRSRVRRRATSSRHLLLVPLVLLGFAMFTILLSSFVADRGEGRGASLLQNQIATLEARVGTVELQQVVTTARIQTLGPPLGPAAVVTQTPAPSATVVPPTTGP